MKITLAQVYAAVTSGALARLAAQKLPVKLSYWIAQRLLKQVQSEYDTLEQARTAMLARYDADDADWRNSKEKLDAFGAEFSELLTETVEINGRAYTLDELPDTLEITPSDMQALDWLFAEAQPTE